MKTRRCHSRRLTNASRALRRGSSSGGRTLANHRWSKHR